MTKLLEVEGCQPSPSCTFGCYCTGPSIYAMAIFCENRILSIIKKHHGPLKEKPKTIWLQFYDEPDKDRIEVVVHERENYATPYYATVKPYRRKIQLLELLGQRFESAGLLGRKLYMEIWYE